MDCDLPYLNQQKGNVKDIYTIIDLPCYLLQSSLLNISKQIPKSGIYKASLYKEFDIFKDFIDLDSTFVVNRINKNAFYIPNLILNIKLFLFIFKLRPSIIHTTLFYDFQDLLLYFFRRKTLLTVHDPFPHSGENSRRVSFFRKIGFKLLNNFIILNTKQKREFIASNKLKYKNVFDSSLGVYDVYHLYSKQTTKLERSNSILFFGRISPYKGIHILLEAMKSLHLIHPEVKLIIAGSGEYYFDKTEFEQLDYIDFRNRYIPNEELVKLLNESLFVVCPYTDATQSGVIMTSFAFCKPVVASDVGGLAEMVIDKVTGRLVEPNNSIDLKNTMISLISNQNLIEAMKHNIKTHFYLGDKGWKQISKNLFAVYEIVSKK